MRTGTSSGGVSSPTATRSQSRARWPLSSACAATSVTGCELLLRVLFRARMWKTMPLPDFLFGLYPLLSPLEWVVFRLRRHRPDTGRQ